MNITQTSKAAFLAYAAEAAAIGAAPLVGRTEEARNNLIPLVQAGLIEICSDGKCEWVLFTDAGKAFAAQNRQ